MRNGDRKSELFCGFLDALRGCVILTLVLLNFGVFPVSRLENIAHAVRLPCLQPTGAAVPCPAACPTPFGVCTVTPPAPVTGLSAGACALAVISACGPGTFNCPGTRPGFPVLVPPKPPVACNCAVAGFW